MVFNGALLLNAKTFTFMRAQQYKIGIQWPEAKIISDLHNELALSASLPRFNIASDISKIKTMI